MSQHRMKPNTSFLARFVAGQVKSNERIAPTGKARPETKSAERQNPVVFYQDVHDDNALPGGGDLVASPPPSGRNEAAGISGRDKAAQGQTKDPKYEARDELNNNGGGKLSAPTPSAATLNLIEAYNSALRELARMKLCVDSVAAAVPDKGFQKGYAQYDPVAPTGGGPNDFDGVMQDLATIAEQIQDVSRLVDQYVKGGKPVAKGSPAKITGTSAEAAGVEKALRKLRLGSEPSSPGGPNQPVRRHFVKASPPARPAQILRAKRAQLQGQRAGDE